MGSRGDAYDNAVAETFFATLKKELVNRRSWPSRARAAVRRVRVHRGVLQPPTPALHPRDALPRRLRTTTTLAAGRLRSIARTTTINRQTRCHANRGRSILLARSWLALSRASAAKHSRDESRASRSRRRLGDGQHRDDPHVRAHEMRSHEWLDRGRSEAWHRNGGARVGAGTNQSRRAEAAHVWVRQQERAGALTDYRFDDASSSAVSDEVCRSRRPEFEQAPGVCRRRGCLARTAAPRGAVIA